MAHPNRLSSGQLRALARLSTVPALQPFHLAGGTAVAFHLGHRTSRDLDLFGIAAAGALSTVGQAVTDAFPGAQLVAATDAALHLVVDETTPIDIVAYRYPLLADAVPGPEGFPVAGLLDLAVMKLAAISRRGIRRDFWDLHEIATRGGVTLDDALDGYIKRFGKSEPDLYHVLRALTYFDDAEAEEVFPQGLQCEHWDVIKGYFLEHAPAALSRRGT
jgi:Nucleotidyl transferase AbiEii toxin, Type IV TA system